jgi:hypothetical protein
MRRLRERRLVEVLNRTRRLRVLILTRTLRSCRTSAIAIAKTASSGVRLMMHCVRRARASKRGRIMDHRDGTSEPGTISHRSEKLDYAELQ